MNPGEDPNNILPRSVAEAANRSMSKVMPSEPADRPSVQPPVNLPIGPVAPMNPFKPSTTAPRVTGTVPQTLPLAPKLETDWPFATAQTQEKARATVPTLLQTATAPALIQPVVPGPTIAVPISPTIPRPLPPRPTQPPLQQPPQEVPRQSAQSAPTLARPTASATPIAPLHAGSSSIPHEPIVPLKNIRTYEGDVAAVLAERNPSKASMAVAESERRGEGTTIGTMAGSDATERSTGRAWWKLAIIILCIALVGGGSTVGYYLYMKSPLGAQPAAPVTQHALPSLVPSDSQAVIATDGLASGALLTRVRSEIAKPQSPGTMKEVLFTETKNASTYRVSAAEMAALMSVPVPDIILRTLEPQWMFGIYAPADGDKSAFVVVTTDLFQNAFAGMLAWEGQMPEDLKNYLSYQAGTSTVAYKPAPRGHFEDRIVQNKDVRAFIADDGTTVFAYSFLDNSTLAIAQDEGALAEIITRLENKAFVR